MASASGDEKRLFYLEIPVRICYNTMRNVLGGNLWDFCIFWRISGCPV
jgi:hypothetical protein